MSPRNMNAKQDTQPKAAQALPTIPKELIDQFVNGPMSAEAVNAASMACRRRPLSSNYKGFPIVVKQKSLVVESRSD